MCFRSAWVALAEAGRKWIVIAIMSRKAHMGLVGMESSVVTVEGEMGGRARRDAAQQFWV